MKAPENTPPALCDFPLIEPPRSTVKTAPAPRDFKSRRMVLTMAVEFFSRLTHPAGRP